VPDGSLPLKSIDYVLRKLDWMRVEGIWPNGFRYLWTDAFGLVLMVLVGRVPETSDCRGDHDVARDKEPFALERHEWTTCPRLTTC
jgi:hypothetical protein